MNVEWDSVTVLQKRGAKAPTKSSKSKASQDKAVTESRRKGQDVETTKKYGAGGNAQRHAVKNTADLDRETDVQKHGTVKMETSRAIAQGRQALGITQKELATKIDVRPSIINDYESGKAIPDGKIITKMERILKTRLTGKSAGQPIPPKGGKK